MFTMDGRFPFIRHDDDGMPRLGPASYAMMLVALVVLVASMYWALTL